MPAVRSRLAAMAIVLAVVGAALTTIVGCSRPGLDDSRIRITGSDTMVNLAQAWAEAYRTDHPEIFTEVRGGGSGVGIASLCGGEVQIATSSRAMKPKEIELARANTGRVPKEYIVGRDAMAIYVHKDNPLDVISLEQLAEIYGEGGRITKWKQLGVDNAACTDGEVIRISRQNNSGTYAYFKELVLGKKREYKQGALSQSGSSELVGFISRTPCAIGYSGMGYRTDEVKVLKIARKKGEAGIAPTIATALDGTYPISRPLYIYTLGEPTGTVQEFIKWVLSPEGQRIVAKKQYVPIVAPMQTAARQSPQGS